MKLIVALCLVAVVAAAPPPRAKYSNVNVSVLRYDNNVYGNGEYNFRYEQSDGQRRNEQRVVKNAGLENESIVIKGSYHWISPDGVEYHIVYIADKDGFRPMLHHGPGISPIPLAVLASSLG